MSDRDRFEPEFRPAVPSVPYRDPVNEGINKQDEAIRSRKSIGNFVAFGGLKTSAKIQETRKTPELGKPCELLPPPTLSATPVTPSSCNLREAKQIQILGGPTLESLSARQKLEDIKQRIAQTEVPKLPPPHRPTSPDELRLGISVERLVFLERVEKIMASEARIKEIEVENKTLIGMVGRLQKEIEELKAKLGQKL